MSSTASVDTDGKKSNSNHPPPAVVPARNFYQGTLMYRSTVYGNADL